MSELSSVGDIVRLRVVYPDGTKLQRNFLETDDLSLLLDLVELDMYDNGMDEKPFELCMSIPRLVLNEVRLGDEIDV